MYEYKAIVTSVYDGDTITANIDLGFGIWAFKQKFRLLNIDTPEIRTKDPEEKIAGYQARDALRAVLEATENHCIIRTTKDTRGKYGRWLAEIFIGDINVNDWLIQKGFAKHYEATD